MTLAIQIVNDMKTAMKAREKLRLNAIRMLRSTIKDKEISLGHTLNDAEIHAVLANLIKRRQEAASQYDAANRDDLAAIERAESDIYMTYLPCQLSEDEVFAAINTAISAVSATNMRDMGKVMAYLKDKLQATADMRQVSVTVKRLLSNSG